MKNSETLARWTRPDGTYQDGTLDEIGPLYWAAKQREPGHKITKLHAPDVSADLVEDVDDPTEEVAVRRVTMATPVAKVAKREPITVTPRTAEDTIAAHEMARDYIQSRGGDTSDGTWFPPGTEMMEIGKREYRGRSKTHADLPPIREAYAPAIERVKQEDRRISGVVNLAECQITTAEKGFAIYRPGSGKPALPLEYMALEQLHNAVSAGMPGPLSRMLRTMPSGEFVDLFNRQILRAAEHQTHTEARIQHRNHMGRRSAFSFVGKGYMPMPLDHILATAATELERIGEELGVEARGEVSYQPGSTLATYKATWHAPEEYAARVGDPIEIGLKGSTGGAGNGFHRTDQQLTLIKCINCTLMVWAALALKRRHSGSKSRSASQNLAVGMERVREDLRASVDGLGDGVRLFGNLWGILKATPVNAVALAGEKHTDVRTALEAMVAKGQITKEVARDALTESLLTAFDREPGDSLADLVNAVTRAAHEGMISDIQQWKVERDAGELMVALARKAQPEALKAMRLPASLGRGVA